MIRSKIPAGLLAASIFIGSFAGCNADKNGSLSDTAADADVTSVPQTVQAQDLERKGEMRDISPSELIAEMNVGWNLGNSLDAYDGTGLDTEISWGNPRTTKAMIDEVHAKGFDVIRIPVTWAGHMGEEPEYKIDLQWLDRVQEVVNYAIDNDMYVILDSHHEEKWRIPDNEHIDAVSDKVYALWQQTAERFRDYGDHLIFEGMNEPRVAGGENEWNGGTEEGRRCVDRLNQTFIDAVRSVGGNNEDRLLLITTFASASAPMAINDVAIPDDDHIAFSIHAYTPYAFTYNANASWELFEWDGSHDIEIKNMFNDLKKAFIDKGIPVIITEFGAVNKNGNDEEVAKWVKYYLETAGSLGIPCVWWDNGYYYSGNELFGIFDRSRCTWYTDTVTDAIMEVCSKN